MLKSKASKLTLAQYDTLQELVKAKCSNLALADSEVQQVQLEIKEAIDDQEFIVSEDKRSLLQFGLKRLKKFFSSNVNTALLELIDPILQMFGVQQGRDMNVDISINEFWENGTAERAFEADYTEHGGEEAFWNHLYQQKEKFIKEKTIKFPFFAIVQSSGYGKSRLVLHLKNTMELIRKRNITGDPHTMEKIIYLSFASLQAYPDSNVMIDIKLHGMDRKILEAAFLNLFQDAWNNPDASKFSLQLGNIGTMETPSDQGQKQEQGQEQGQTQKQEQQEQEQTNVLFVLDEVSQLLKCFAKDRVNFFRCFRKAAVDFNDAHSNCFFVLLATQSSTNQVIPGFRNDPSLKKWTENDDVHREPLEPFLMLHAVGLRNDEKAILELPVRECHQPRNLLAMGRPMWQAFIDTLHADDVNASSLSSLVKFALAKLLSVKQPIPPPDKLSQEQCIALLACRACLTISPISWLAPSLVSSHMATAVKISLDREELTVEYPSEPILAIAARRYMLSYPDIFLQQGIREMKACFLSSAVPKGHRGEVIVRLLNLLAIDKAMKINGGKYDVKEVDLVAFLSQFDREGSQLSSLIEQEREGVAPKWKGTVCFTHFVYLSRPSDKVPLITPDLLRYAYRRTAAIAVDEGRKGIDWIIPVRVGIDEFVGLCGQDKNRKNDSLEKLVKKTKDETHGKLKPSFFLTPEEIELFKVKEWRLDWPSMLFSIGGEIQGAALAEQDDRMLRSNKEVLGCRMPCIVLTGLGYDKLVTKDTDSWLQQFRDAVADVPEVYKERVPLTYGCQSGK